MMSTPLWERALNAILTKEFQFSITDGNDAAWGFALCVLGLIYHTSNSAIYELLNERLTSQRKDDELAHDRAIYRNADALLQEQQFLSFMRTLLGDHSYHMQNMERIDKFVRYLAPTSNQFLSPTLRAAAAAFVEAAYQHGEFVALQFFVFPKGQTESNVRLCMKPGWNCDREGSGSPEQIRMYDQLTKELETLSNTVISRYHDLRSAVKQELVI